MPFIMQTVGDANSKQWFTTSEEGAGKRCSVCAGDGHGVWGTRECGEGAGGGGRRRAGELELFSMKLSKLVSTMKTTSCFYRKVLKNLTLMPPP